MEGRWGELGVVKGEMGEENSQEKPAPSVSSSRGEVVLQWLKSKAQIDPAPWLQSSLSFHEGLIAQSLRVLLSQPGRFVCSLRVPPHLTNSSRFLHEGVIGSLVDNVGAAAFVTLDGHVRVSVDLNVSYMFPARIDDEVEIEANVLKFGTAVGVVVVVLKNKTTGQLVAQGRHTLYYPSSKL